MHFHKRFAFHIYVPKFTPEDILTIFSTKKKDFDYAQWGFHMKIFLNHGLRPFYQFYTITHKRLLL